MSTTATQPFPWGTLSTADLDPTERISFAHLTHEVERATGVFLDDGIEELEPEDLDLVPIDLPDRPADDGHRWMWFACGMAGGIVLSWVPAVATVAAVAVWF